MGLWKDRDMTSCAGVFCFSNSKRNLFKTGLATSVDILLTPAFLNLLEHKNAFGYFSDKQPFPDPCW